MKVWTAVPCVVLVFSLSGCMATLGSLSGNGPVAQARRTTYIKAHPDGAYNGAIQDGRLAVGMSLDDLQALYGSQCGYSATSSAGTFYECHLNALDYDDEVMVLIDNSGRVASWVE